MPRQRFPRSPDFPYHITARCHERRPFWDLEQTWRIVSEELYFVARAYSLEVLSFVLMPNHFHLLARSPTLELSAAMNHFMPAVTKRSNEASKRQNQLWSRRFHRCLIRDEYYLRNAYKYVYRNPVEAGLVSRVEDWPYGTLYGLLGRAPLFIPIRTDHLLFDDPEQSLKWLNEDVTMDQWKSVEFALKKREFKMEKSHWTRAALAPSDLRI